MKQTLLDLLTSKKFLAAATAIIVYLAGRFGWNVDPTVLDHIWQALLVYVGAQGVADLGKSAALVRAAAPNSPPAFDSGTAPKASGPAIATLALVVLAVGAAGSLTACTKTELGAAATSAEHAIVNCTGQALGTTPALNIETLVAIANTAAAERLKCTPPGGDLDWSCVEADAIREGEVIGGCALVQLIASSIPAATARVAAAASPDPGRAALEDFRARVAGGATYHTVSGDI